GNILKADYINKIDALNKLILKTFDYFLLLPVDIQAEILKIEGLRYLFRLNKSISKALASTFYQKFCHLLITDREQDEYIKRKQPQLFFITYNTNNNFKMYTKLYIQNNIKITYLITVKVHFKTIHTYKASCINDPDSLIDLKNAYNIYKNRVLEQIKPGYAKNKILDRLNFIYTNTNFNKYTALYYFYYYLRLNAKIFDIVINKNKFKHYE